MALALVSVDLADDGGTKIHPCELPYPEPFLEVPFANMLEDTTLTTLPIGMMLDSFRYGKRGFLLICHNIKLHFAQFLPRFIH